MIWLIVLSSTSIIADKVHENTVGIKELIPEKVEKIVTSIIKGQRRFKK